METKIKAYMESKLKSSEITKEVVVSAYMNEYPEEFLYTYPSFFLNKLSKLKQPSSHTQKAIDDVKTFLNTHSGDKMDKSIVVKFFNLESVTPDLIGYVGW